jgi:hypothetical protein
VGALIGAFVPTILLFLPKLSAGAARFLPDPDNLALYFPIFVVFIYLGVVIHETGHFLAGRLAGLSLNFVRFGPIQINAPFKLSWHRQRGGARGVTSMLPKTGNVTTKQVILLLIGGPAANLLSAALIILLYESHQELPWLPSVFVAASLFLGLGNLVPFQNRAAVSDGKRLWMLISSKGRGERWIALFQMIAAISQGTDYENLPDELIVRATAFLDNSPDTVSAHVLAYCSASYRKENERAAQLLETALAFSGFSSPMLREALIADAAVFQARKRKNVVLAQQWFADLPAKPQTPTLRLNVEAAIFEAQEDFVSAFRALEENEKIIRAMPNQLQRDLSLRSLQRWRSELLMRTEQQTSAVT